VVVTGVFERPLHLLDRQGTEGVSYFGAVYGDLGDPLRLVVRDVLEFSGRVPVNVDHGEDYRYSKDFCRNTKALQVKLTADPRLHGDHERLGEQGVEFVSPPEEKIYVIKAFVKDNSGNRFILTQRKKQSPSTR
jgi:hypothetical protein